MCGSIIKVVWFKPSLFRKKVSVFERDDILKSNKNKYAAIGFRYEVNQG